MRESTIRASAFAAVAAAFLLAAPAGAQQQPQAPMAPQGATPSTEFSETQLDAFAAAAEDVNRLQQEYDAKLQAAGSDQEAESLRGEAADAMMGALEEQGITPEEYNSIVQAAQADPALYASIVERMQTAD